MYLQFLTSEIMDKAKREFWQQQEADGKELTAFDSFSSGGGECSASNGDNVEFEAFLIRKGYNYWRSEISLKDKYNR